MSKKQVKETPMPYGFAESFGAYANRCGAECTCGKLVVSWQHRSGCRLRDLYEIWSAHGKQAWARIKSLPGYVDEYAPVRRLTLVEGAAS